MSNKETYILSLDAGTTSERAALFNQEGKLVGQVARPIKQIYPHPAWVEHDPMEILSTQVGVMSEVLVKYGVQSSQIAGIGITNQRETSIVWDKNTGLPIYNAIVWQCRRTADMVAKLRRDNIPDLIQKKTGLILDPYFSASKIAWILDNVEGAREKAEQGDLLFGTVDSWLIYKLTQGEVHATDYTNASRTMLYNIHELAWDDELLELFNIPRSMMPEVRSSSGDFGVLSPELYPGSLRITGVAGDQQASLFGHCCFEPGMVKNTYGTGCFMLMNTGDHAVSSQNGLLSTIGIADGDKIQYALEGSVFIAGAVIQWLRDELKLIESAQETEALALEAKSTDGVYIVPAFTGLGAPYWNPEARGLICGLSRGTNKAQLVRAALESMAYQTNDIIQAMQKDSGLSLSQLAVDGGASVNTFLLQFQADILRSELIRPEISETTALGAAYLAGLALGYYKDKKSLLDLHQTTRIIPNIDEEKRNSRLKGWHEAIKKTLL
ncbi:MAG: glycerol kinase GlpK [Coriobacteriia bacterium]|nr:glycerol kinase GlpK [Coriobacteriia bacterium]